MITKCALAIMASLLVVYPAFAADPAQLNEHVAQGLQSLAKQYQEK